PRGRARSLPILRVPVASRRPCPLAPPWDAAPPIPPDPPAATAPRLPASISGMVMLKSADGSRSDVTLNAPSARSVSSDAAKVPLTLPCRRVKLPFWITSGRDRPEVATVIPRRSPVTSILVIQSGALTSRPRTLAFTPAIADDGITRPLPESTIPDVISMFRIVTESIRLSENAGDLAGPVAGRSEEHTSELQSRGHLVCRLLLEKKKKTN